MKSVHNALLTVLTLAGLAAASGAMAQTTTTVIIDNCRGEATVQAQRQDGTDLQLDVDVAIAGCDGVCTGSLEYTLRMQDGEQREVIVHLTENWHWREAKEPFALTLRPAISPGMTLQEVVAMQIGRCSCSTGQITNEL